MWSRTMSASIGRDSHALPVDRVEAADAVAEHDQSLGEAGQPFVVSSPAGGKPVGDRIVDRLGLANRFVDVGEGQ